MLVLPASEARLSDDDLEPVVRAYLECALWSSHGDVDDDGNAEPLDANHDIRDVSLQGWDEAREIIADFVARHPDSVSSYPLDPEQFGHDLWLTRNGHGTGFWDRGLGTLGERLTEAAHSFGEAYPYVGDDGKLYGFGY
jgi:hypothetical protein